MRLLTAALVLSALAVILGWPWRINNDAAMYLTMAQMLLDGGTLYVDIIDVNPPLITYLSLLPAAAARALGTYPPLTFLLMVWAAVAWSSGATRKVLATAGWGERAGVVAASAALFSLWVLWLNEFGQREHLFALAWVPYFLLRCFRQRGAPAPARWRAAVMGVAAGLTSALKPHFALIAFAPELYWMIRRRGRPILTTELYACVACVAAYALHFLVLPGAMREAWFDRWVPMIVDGYHVYAMPLASLAKEWTLWLPAGAAAAAILMTWRAPVWRDFGAPLLIVLVIALANVFVQRKGWHYQALPGEAAAVIAAALLACAPVVRALAKTRTAAGAAAVAACAAAVLASGFFVMRPRTAGVDARIAAWNPHAREIVSRTRRHDYVMVISTGVSPAFPLLAQIERRPGSRYMFAFPIPMAYRGTQALPGTPFDYLALQAGREEIERRYRLELEEDIRRHRPNVIVVDDRCQACPPGFTLRGYLHATGLGRSALAEYRELEGTGVTGLFVRR